MSLIYKEETHRLRRGLFDVQNEVGLGKHEKGYQQGCELWLKESDVPFVARAPHHIRLRDKIVHTMRPDLVVWDKVTVELKAEPRNLQNSDFVQLFDYLKFRRDRLGLLVNMGLTRVEVERVPYEQPEYGLEEDWQYWSGRITGRDREIGAQLRDALLLIRRSASYERSYSLQSQSSMWNPIRLTASMKLCGPVGHHSGILKRSSLHCFSISMVPLPVS